MPGAAGSVSRAGSRGFAELICSCVHLLLLSSSDSTSQGAAAAVPALLAIYLFIQGCLGSAGIIPWNFPLWFRCLYFHSSPGQMMAPGSLVFAGKKSHL